MPLNRSWGKETVTLEPVGAAGPIAACGIEAFLETRAILEA
jgi:hypothetical protein